MSFSLFTLDVATVCPEEYAKWQAAIDEHSLLWRAHIEGRDGVSEAEVLAAGARRRQAEAVARLAYRRATQ